MYHRPGSRPRHEHPHFGVLTILPLVRTFLLVNSYVDNIIQRDTSSHRKELCVCIRRKKYAVCLPQLDSTFNLMINTSSFPSPSKQTVNNICPYPTFISRRIHIRRRNDVRLGLFDDQSVTSTLQDSVQSS